MIENYLVINLLNHFNPSEMALLDWLKPHVDDSLLREIAAADYGCDEEEYFEALKRIRDQQKIPTPLRWMPREVLELMRWSEPDDPAWQPGISETRRHLARAFSCAVLLKAADSPETRDYISAENETLIQLIASVLYLGYEASESALRFLCWRVLRLSCEDDETPFFALALLLLRAALFEPDQDGTHLKLLADWVVSEERDVRKGQMAISKSEDWLLGLTFHNQRHEVWKKLAQEVLLNPAKSFPDPGATAMRNIVKRLIPEMGQSEKSRLID